ncbi:MAG: hypothetical protein J0I06_16785, partial [Planctomycetes bacterium]|nr:hypothetical protein [Planctomycetota bacterium]
MKSALGCAAGVAVCLLLTACESSGRRAGGESRKNVSPPSATDGPPKPLPSGPVAQVGPYPVGDPGPRALRVE